MSLEGAAASVIFVATKKFCRRDRTRVLSRQTRICRDKSKLVATKMIPVAVPAIDTTRQTLFLIYL